VVDRSIFRPVATGAAIINAAKGIAPDEFAWLPPPYEYECEKMPIDILWGSDALRLAIDSGRGIDGLLAESEIDAADFENLVAPFLLYD
jgi:uncharacterized protein YbbC (DUF1343 family)